jgi:hypothetical protein
MIGYQTHCPSDKSRLVFLSGVYNSGDFEQFDISFTYCPPWDMAFVFLSKAGSSASPVAVLEWYRSGCRFLLCDLDQECMFILPRSVQEYCHAKVPKSVGTYISIRHVETFTCLMDGCKTNTKQAGSRS